MELDAFISKSCTRYDIAASSKKRALELASELLAEHYPELDASTLLDALVARERLGSTALGEGAALPHCRMASCQQPVAALLKLADPVGFDASDRQPVDLLFVLVVPEAANDLHLQILASIAGALHEPAYRTALRAAGDDAALYDAARKGLADTTRVRSERS